MRVQRGVSTNVDLVVIEKENVNIRLHWQYCETVVSE
jgi:hypothetical protein